MLHWELTVEKYEKKRSKGNTVEEVNKSGSAKDTLSPSSNKSAEKVEKEEKSKKREEPKTSKEASDAEKQEGGEEEAERVVFTFPERLMELLDEEVALDSMWWLEDGKGFCVDPKVFADKVLNKYFQGTKFESFTRKLNRWGFKRAAGQHIPQHTIAYYHTLFQRGKPDLLKTMSGGKKKESSSGFQDKMLAKHLGQDMRVAGVFSGGMLGGGLHQQMNKMNVAAAQQLQFNNPNMLSLVAAGGYGLPNPLRSQFMGSGSMMNNPQMTNLQVQQQQQLDQELRLQLYLAEQQRADFVRQQQQQALFAAGIAGGGTGASNQPQQHELSMELRRRLLAGGAAGTNVGSLDSRDTRSVYPSFLS